MRSCKITYKILFMILISSTLGTTLSQLLYLTGLKYTTPTVASALTTVLPVVTFIMALPFRLDNENIKTASRKAKIAAIVLCVGGSLIITFYKGTVIRVPSSGIHWKYAEDALKRGETNSTGGFKKILGTMLVIASCIASAAWFYLQARISKAFPAPCITSTLFSAMAAVECLLIGVIGERDFKRWALGLDIRLAVVMYTEKFFNGYPSIDVLSQKMTRQLGIRDGDGSGTGTVLRNPPWICCCPSLITFIKTIHGEVEGT